eukprot:1161172-Pelagomonas_calceolata.AAC.3
MQRTGQCKPLMCAPLCKSASSYNHIRINPWGSNTCSLSIGGMQQHMFCGARVHAEAGIVGYRAPGAEHPFEPPAEDASPPVPRAGRLRAASTPRKYTAPEGAPLFPWRLPQGQGQWRPAS